MWPDTLIEAAGVSKAFEQQVRPARRFWNLLRNAKDKVPPHANWVLKDIGFQLHRGEAIGVIGRNGSGKSTLLQILCGTLEKTTGRLNVGGKIGAILELGAGFNPNFTGRENVVLNASVLGIRKKFLAEKLEQIIHFADIGEYIDQPIKYYSSGMVVRLAFAVVANIDADILIIDEALAVGDVLFQQKCLRYLEKFRENGGAILFVSHDTGLVSSFCDRALYLRRVDGEATSEFGASKAMCNMYMSDLYQKETTEHTSLVTPAVKLAELGDGVFSGNGKSVSEIKIGPWNSNAERFGIHPNSIAYAGFVDAEGRELSELLSGELVRFVVKVNPPMNLSMPSLTILIKDRSGKVIFSDCSLKFFDVPVVLLSDRETIVEFRFVFPNLTTSEYTIDLALANGTMLDHDQIDWVHDGLVISATNTTNLVGVSGLASCAITWGRHV